MFKSKILIALISCSSLSVFGMGNNLHYKSQLACTYSAGSDLRFFFGVFDYNGGYNRQVELQFTGYDSHVNVIADGLVCENCWTVGLRMFADLGSDRFLELHVPYADQEKKVFSEHAVIYERFKGHSVRYDTLCMTLLHRNK